MSGMSIVAHNLPGMNSNRQLGIVSKRKGKSTEKLSSGYKINRAADDAAGLSISEKMRKQIRGLTQGTDNAQDGVSMCQTADGALAEVQDMLHRITELSVKAANGTNSPSDRQDIQSEINEILKEIDRVSTTTKFNELKILQGDDVVTETKEPKTVGNFRVTGAPITSTEGKHIISASNDGFTIDSQNYSWDVFSDSFGNTFTDSTITPGTYSFEHDGITMHVDVSENASLEDVASKLNGAGYSTKNTFILEPFDDWVTLGRVPSVTCKQLIGVTTAFDTTPSNKLPIYGNGYAENSNPRVVFSNKSGQLEMTFYSGLVDKGGNEISITSLLCYDFGPPLPADADLDTLTDFPHYNPAEFWGGCTEMGFFEQDIESYTGIPGSKGQINLGIRFISQTAEVGAWGKLWQVSEHDDGAMYIIKEGIHDVVDRNGVIRREIESNQSGGEWVKRATVPVIDKVFSSDDNLVKKIWIQSGADNSDDNGMYLEIGRMDTEVLGIRDLNASTLEGARDAIGRMEPALLKLNDIRSRIGAQQNRLEHTIKHQNNTIENTQHAESVIRDTDIAEEMVRFSKESILEQAGQAMLSQANQSNQGILSLLQ